MTTKTYQLTKDIKDIDGLIIANKGEHVTEIEIDDNGVSVETIDKRVSFCADPEDLFLVSITPVSDETKQIRRAEAGEILRQLGGGKFIAMTGAQYFSFEESYPYANASFKFRGSKVATHCRIRLDASDTYIVTFFKIRGATCKTVSEHKGIYNDMLQAHFTEVTGLYTSLGTMGR